MIATLRRALAWLTQDAASDRHVGLLALYGPAPATLVLRLNEDGSVWIGYQGSGEWFEMKS